MDWSTDGSISPSDRALVEFIAATAATIARNPHLGALLAAPWRRGMSDLARHVADSAGVDLVISVEGRFARLCFSPRHQDRSVATWAARPGLWQVMRVGSRVSR